MLTYLNLVLPMIPLQEARTRHLKVMMLKVIQESKKEKRIGKDKKRNA